MRSLPRLSWQFFALMMRTDPIGLYIHIPFCLRKCNYCDFCSYESYTDRDIDGYVSRLCREIQEYKSEDRIAVNSVFFGGGTPSLIPHDLISKILESVRDTFLLLEDAEISLEVNPGCADFEKLSAYHSYGVNRISIGLQSIHENELKILGRVHDFSDFLSTCEAARRAGFSNINIDLMYGIPSQSKQSFAESLKAVLSLNPEHLSVYSLILEDGTPLSKISNTLAIPDDDTVYEMYEECNMLLSEHGYSHYEISNYAKYGYECRHNLKYWQGGEFLGFGLAAYSYFNNMRFGNFGARDSIDHIKQYINSVTVPRCHSELVDEQSRINDFIMLALRTKYGINYQAFKKCFSVDFKETNKALIKKYTDLGLAVDDGKTFCLNDKGMFLSNTIISDFI